MTQLELAYALKVTPTTVSKWERGAAKPKFKILADLARVLRVTEQELVRSDENDD
jgi:transcriptional regulator with XRE-family HTH domain